MGSPTDTTSRVYMEGFSGRDYAAINSYYFQDLRPGTQPVQPVVLPDSEFSAYGEPGKTLGGRWSLDGSVLMTARDNSAAPADEQGADTRRLSLNAGWQRQMISETGLLTTVSGLVRGDGYWADEVPNIEESGEHYNNVLIGRQFEQADVTVRYPMARQGDGYQQTLEPIAMLTGAPVTHLDSRQPIEDSQDFEFNDTNLFSSNRYTGTDLIEGGSRATYGLRNEIITDDGSRVEMFGGQSYSFNRRNDFPYLSGLTDQVSDYVGRISATPGPWLESDYGFRLDHKSGVPQEQDAHVSFGVPEFRPSLRYISAYETDTTGLVDAVKEGTFGFSSTFDKYYTFTASQIQAFNPDPGPRTTLASINYVDECFVFGVTFRQDYTTRLDVNSGTSVEFHFYLKNVGGLHTDSFTSPIYATQFRQTD
jgi:LPS-assembly protein